MSDPANRTIYRNVLLVLLVGTILTVYVAVKVDLGRPGNLALGLLIAAFKATCVVLFFMHLKYEKRWWLSLVLFPIALVMIIIFSNFPDTGLNEDALPQPEKVISVPGKSGGGH